MRRTCLSARVAQTWISLLDEPIRSLARYAGVGITQVLMANAAAAVIYRVATSLLLSVGPDWRTPIWHGDPQACIRQRHRPYARQPRRRRSRAGKVAFPARG